MEKLRRYDIYAPVNKSDKKYSYNEAADIVMESFLDFDPRFADMAKEIRQIKDDKFNEIMEIQQSVGKMIGGWIKSANAANATGTAK